uniref:Uncharacterized protein n=1 Tax=Rhizophora mucronata TaxID=61149 RepID=A0A2P2M7A5_RHIMU
MTLFVYTDEPLFSYAMSNQPIVILCNIELSTETFISSTLTGTIPFIH